MTRSFRRLLLPLVLLSGLAFRGVGIYAGGVPPPLSLPQPPPRLALPGGAAPEEDGPARSTEVAAAAALQKKPGDVLVLPRPGRSEQLSAVSSDTGALPR
jgi:serine/threonine-protein kinase/endoribonuclease IRE1